MNTDTNLPSDQEYVAATIKNGPHCPECSSSQVEGGFIQVELACITQDMVCNECRVSWTDHYELTTYCLRTED